MARGKAGAPHRSFVFRGSGARGGPSIAGTVISCDGLDGAGDLQFLSSASARPPPARARASAPRRRSQVLLTPETLALLGREGDRLRSRALVVGPGRPFSLGSIRLELLPAGQLPGAAALSCEVGERRVLYAGAARLGTPARGAAPGAVRAAQAVCLDATFGHRRFAFLPREEADAAVCAFAASARDAGHAPVVLAAAPGAAQDMAAALAAAGWKLRGHRATVAASVAYRRAGLDTPVVARFTGALARGEALLWPPSERGAPALGRVGSARRAWVSGWASDPDAVAGFGAETAIPYSSHADFAGLLAYVAASGAREVATMRGFAEDFARVLRERDIDAYALGPPRQIPLFSDDS